MIIGLKDLSSRLLRIALGSKSAGHHSVDDLAQVRIDILQAKA